MQADGSLAGVGIAYLLWAGEISTTTMPRGQAVLMSILIFCCLGPQFSR